MDVMIQSVPSIKPPIPISATFVIICLLSEKICKVHTVKKIPMLNKMKPGMP